MWNLWDYVDKYNLWLEIFIDLLIYNYCSRFNKTNLLKIRICHFKICDIYFWNLIFFLQNLFFINYLILRGFPSKSLQILRNSHFEDHARFQSLQTAEITFLKEGNKQRKNLLHFNYVPFNLKLCFVDRKKMSLIVSF